jgi:hypothetical protein
VRRGSGLPYPAARTPLSAQCRKLSLALPGSDCTVLHEFMWSREGGITSATGRTHPGTHLPRPGGDAAS